MTSVFTKERFPWLDGARCLVTGGAGFVGSNVAEKLVSLGARVTVIDDLSSGSEDNIRSLDLHFVKASITDVPVLKNCLEGTQYVFHLAAIPAVPRSVDRPMDTAWANIWGTQSVLEGARLAGVKRLVYSSSSSAYGSIEGEFPRTEDLAPRPISPYAAQKLAGEYLVRVYSLTMGLDALSLRYFNIFGPKQNPDSAYAAVIPKFIRLALHRETITINGDGEQKRDFTFVDNAVYANLLASNPAVSAKGEVMNIGCGNTYSLNTLVAEIEQIVERKVTTQKSDRRSGDVVFSLADITKAQSIIGYKPIVSFQEGLRRVHDFLRTQMS